MNSIQCGTCPLCPSCKCLMNVSASLLSSMLWDIVSARNTFLLVTCSMISRERVVFLEDIFLSHFQNNFIMLMSTSVDRIGHNSE